jgi:hypothetical protein
MILSTKSEGQVNRKYIIRSCVETLRFPSDLAFQQTLNPMRGSSTNSLCGSKLSEYKNGVRNSLEVDILSKVRNKRPLT